MKVFSQLEKKLIRQMIALDDQPDSFNVFDNIIETFYGEDHIPDYCYIAVISETEVSIQVKNEELKRNSHDPLWLLKLDNELSKMLLTVVKMFEYLNDCDLAFFVGDYDNKRLGNIYIGETYSPFDILDAENKSLIFKYTRKKIFLSETLKALAENDFKSDETLMYEREEIRHKSEQERLDERHKSELVLTKRQLTNTQRALVVTFIGLIASIVLPMFTTASVELKNKSFLTSFEESTFQKLKQNAEIIADSSIINEGKISDNIDNVGSAIAGLQSSIEGQEYPGLEKLNQELVNLNLQMKIINKNLKLNNYLHSKRKRY